MKKSYIALLFLAVIVSFSCTSSLYYKLFLKLLPYLFYSESSLSHSLISIIKTIQRVLISKISRKAILSVRKTKNPPFSSTNIDIKSIQQKDEDTILVFFHYFSSNNNASNSFNFSSNTCSASFTGSGDAISTPAFSALQLDNQSFLLLRTR